MSIMAGFGSPSPMQQVSSAILGSVMARMTRNPDEAKLSDIAVGYVANEAIDDLTVSVKADADFMKDPGVPDKTKDMVVELRQLQQKIVTKMGGVATK